MRHRATKQARATARKQARAAKRRQRQQAERHAMFVRMHKKHTRPQTTRPAEQRERHAPPQRSALDWLLFRAFMDSEPVVTAPRQRQKKVA